jgi:hypothetical protein
MNRQAWILTGIALVMMLGTGGLLSRQKQTQRLGEPGVKLVAEHIYDPDGNVAGTNTVPLPERVLDCDSERIPIAREVLGWLPPDTTYAQRRYRGTNGFEMQVSVVLMGSDRTSIHKPEYCLVGSGWGHHVYEQGHITVRRPHVYELPIMKVTTTREVPRPNGTPLLVRGIYVYWFVADQELTATHGERMWSMARSLIWKGVLQRWAYVSAFSVCLPGQEAATFQRMESLIAAMVPEFQLATGPALSVAREELN